MKSENCIRSEMIEKHLRYRLPVVDVRQSISSTNTVLKQLAAEGARHGYLLVAEEQQEGRGRLGRSFVSPSKTGVYMSLLLQGDNITEDPARITATAAVAVSAAISKVCGAETQIKWVNDLFREGKKVCGILAEASTNPSFDNASFVVLGIGVNLFKPRLGFGELSQTADGILPYRPDTACLRERLVAETANEFFDRLTMRSADEIYEEYRSKLFVLGKNVGILRDGETVTVRVVDIDRDFSLIVEHPSGERKRLFSGEISINSF